MADYEWNILPGDYKQSMPLDMPLGDVNPFGILLLDAFSLETLSLSSFKFRLLK